MADPKIGGSAASIIQEEITEFSLPPQVGMVGPTIGQLFDLGQNI